MGTDSYVFQLNLCLSDAAARGGVGGDLGGIEPSRGDESMPQLGLASPPASKVIGIDGAVDGPEITNTSAGEVTCLMWNRADNSTAVCGRDKMKINAKRRLYIWG